MKNKTANRCRTVLIIAYLVPYAFLSAYGDAVLDTLIFGGIMVAAQLVLAVISLKTHNAAIMFAGNIISAGVSLAAVRLSGLTEMNWFFKPYTAYSIVIAFAIITIILQIIIYVIHIKTKKK